MYRSPTTEDEEFMIQIDAPIKKILTGVEKLIKSEGCDSFWVELLERNLVSDDVTEDGKAIPLDRALRLMGAWADRDGTIHALRNALHHTGRLDLVKKVDGLRRDEVLMSIIVFKRGQIAENLTNLMSQKCLGLKSLMLHVRQMVHTSLGLELLVNGKFVIRIKNAPPGTNWSTPAKKLKGKTVVIAIENHEPQLERKTAPSRLEGVHQHTDEYCGSRKVTSWIDDDRIYFDELVETTDDRPAAPVDVTAATGQRKLSSESTTVEAVKATEDGKFSLLTTVSNRPKEQTIVPADNIDDVEQLTTNFPIEVSENESLA